MRDFKNMKRQRGRNRGGGGVGGGTGGRPQHNANRAFDSNGPDNIKIRGHAQHVFEKYQQLARDAFSSGDRVLAENYLQHADHYFRVLLTIQPQRPPSEILGRDVLASGLDIDFEEEFEAQPEEAQAESADGGDAQSSEGREAGRYDEGRQDRYENGRGDQGGWRDRQGGNQSGGQGGDRQDRYDRQNRDRNFGDRQDRYDRQGGDRQPYERQGYDRQGYDRQGGDRFGAERQGAERQSSERQGPDRQGSDRQDRFEGRRDNRRFEGPRDYGRDNRDAREPRSDESRRDPRSGEPRGDGAEAATPHFVQHQVDPAETVAASAQPERPGSVLRAQDGAVSEAPAFLQAPGAVGEGEEARPRVRRRRAPRSFTPGEEPPAEPRGSERSDADEG